MKTFLFLFRSGGPSYATFVIVFLSVFSSSITGY